MLLTAGIWGFGFVAQRSGMDYVGPFTYNGIRFILGSLSLLPLILYRRAKGQGLGLGQAATPGVGRGRKVLAALSAGTCLFIAVALQQLGILFTTVGNAGFITGLYVVLTPIFGIFLGRKTGLPTWIGAVFTLTGLYFLSAAGHLGVNPGDILMMFSAVFWTCHVLLIDRLVQHIDPIQLSAGQFAFCGIYSLTGVFLLEPFVALWADILVPGYSTTIIWKTVPELIARMGSGRLAPSQIINGLIPILYGGLASVGIAYTLQTVAQKNAPPAHATIILSLEGLFAALGGMLLLGEKPGPWTLLGFVLMLCGMLTTQWDVIGAPIRGRRKQ